MIHIRPMNDEEFWEFDQHAKCRWLECANGMGLAGLGRCAHEKGRWDLPECPAFQTVEDFEAEWQARDFRELPF